MAVRKSATASVFLDRLSVGFIVVVEVRVSESSCVLVVVREGLQMRLNPIRTLIMIKCRLFCCVQSEIELWMSRMCVNNFYVSTYLLLSACVFATYDGTYLLFLQCFLVVLPQTTDKNKK